MKYTRKRIAVSSIYLDRENARHGSLATQRDILEWMVTGEVRSKVLQLAKEISKWGPSPIDLPILIPAEGEKKNRFSVVEGNRRLAALKMLRNPEKCPDKKLRAQFQRLKESAAVELPRSLECVVFPDIASAEYWIKIRHGGENNGAGTVPWGPREFDGFERRMGRISPNRAAVTLMDYALSEGLIEKQVYDKVPVTNVSRLLGTRGVRSLLALDVSKGQVFRTAEKNYTDKTVKSVLDELYYGDWPVTKLKTSDQRVKFVNDLKNAQDWGGYDPKAPEALDLSAAEVKDEPGDGGGDTPPPPKPPKPNPHSLDRKLVIPNSFRMKIKHPRLNDIYHELREMEAKHVNAAAALTRIFLEGCTDLYLKKKGYEIKYSDKLAGKVQKVRGDILKSNSDSLTSQIKDDLKGYEVLAGEHHALASADTLNATIHNMSFSLSAHDIKSIWNNLVNSLKWFEGVV